MAKYYIIESPYNKLLMPEAIQHKHTQIDELL